MAILKVQWGQQFKRTSANPLTADESFTTYADLQTYLGDPLCYPGQTVSVTSDSDSKKNGIYWISGTAGSFSVMKLATSSDVSASTSSVFQWKGNVNSSTLVKSGTSVKAGYAYRWNETATTEAANTLAAANSASGAAEILERGDLLICTEVAGNVPKYSVVQNNVDISDIEDRLSSLNDSIGSVSGRVGTAEGNISTLQGEMTTAKSDISGLKTRMGTAEGNITKNATDISNVSNSLSETQTQLTGLVDTVEDIQTKRP